MDATVFFYCYASSPSTKAEEQRRRAAKHISTDIDVADHIRTTVCQANFLGNPHKNGFTKKLSMKAFMPLAFM